MWQKVTELVKKLLKFSFSIFGLSSPADQSKTKKILVTRPDHDPTTAYLFAWVEPVIELINQNSLYNLVCLEKAKACRSEFLQELKKNPNFVYFNGHGSAHSVTGYNNEPLVTMGNDEEHFKNKIIYALSCQSAKSLGKYLVDNGARTYLGYKDDFIFVINEDVSDPLTDETAKLYLEPSNILVINLLAGKTTGVSHQKSQDKFQENINLLLTTESPADDRDLVPYLYWDKEHQVCLGDKEAII